MPTNAPALDNGLKSLVNRHPVATYFILAFVISWAGALAVAAPHLICRGPLPQITGALMFSAMLLGPSLAEMFLTALLDGKPGLKELFAQMARVGFPGDWFAALLIPRS